MANFKKQPTKKDIEQWQTDYKDDLVCIALDPQDEDSKKLYIRKPTSLKTGKRIFYSQLMKLHRQDEPFKIGELIFNQCALGGDEILTNKESDEYIAMVVHLGSAEHVPLQLPGVVDISKK